MHERPSRRTGQEADFFATLLAIVASNKRAHYFLSKANHSFYCRVAALQEHLVFGNQLPALSDSGRGAALLVKPNHT